MPDGQNTDVLVLGGIIVDQYLMVPSFPERGGDILISDSSFRVGGCSINVAMTLKNLGLNPLAISVIGDDFRGQMIYQYLQENGLSTDLVTIRRGATTGYCVSIVENSGERTFLTYKGCESTFDLGSVHTSAINSVKYIYVTGYYLMDATFALSIIQFVQSAKKNGATVLFDPGALVNLIRPDLLLSIIHAADIVTPNVIEMQKISSVLNVDGDLSRWLLTNGVGTVIRKMGENGADVFTDVNYFHAQKYSVPVIDTSGAGDSFAAGLLYAVAHDFELELAVRFASACGAMATTKMGAHVYFTVDDVEELIERPGDGRVR